MRRLLAVGLAALLVGCTTTPGAESGPATGTPEGETRAAPTLTRTLIPTRPTLTATLERPSATSSPEPECDVEQIDCILDGHFYFQRPIAEPDTRIADLSYLFGSTQSGSRQPHHGVDLPNASGTPVLAAANGTVVFAGSDAQELISPWPNLYGNVVIIEHQFAGIGMPVYSLYGHLSKVSAAAGQSVRAGELIGEVGATGAAIGSHLHFEVRVGGNAYSDSQNPALWLIPLAGTGVLAGRIADAQGNLRHLGGLRLQYQAPGSDALAPVHQLETYAAEKDPVHGDDTLGENFALGDLRPGQYRLTFISNGRLYERWAEVRPGRLSFLDIIVK